MDAVVLFEKGVVFLLRAGWVVAVGLLLAFLMVDHVQAICR